MPGCLGCLLSGEQLEQFATLIERGCIWILDVGIPSSSGMEFLDDIFEPGLIDVSVNLGGDDIGVA